MYFMYHITFISLVATFVSWTRSVVTWWQSCSGRITRIMILIILFYTLSNKESALTVKCYSIVPLLVQQPKMFPLGLLCRYGKQKDSLSFSIFEESSEKKGGMWSEALLLFHFFYLWLVVLRPTAGILDYRGDIGRDSSFILLLDTI